MELTDRVAAVGTVEAMVRAERLAFVYTTRFQTIQSKEFPATRSCSSVVGANPRPFGGFQAVGLTHRLATPLTSMTAWICLVD